MRKAGAALGQHLEALLPVAGADGLDDEIQIAGLAQEFAAIIEAIGKEMLHPQPALAIKNNLRARAERDVGGGQIDRQQVAEPDRIKAAPSPLERTQRALRLVQDDIRYFAVCMDGGNYVPQKPAETWARRYGDCKAKALLLTLLRASLHLEQEPIGGEQAINPSCLMYRAMIRITS